MATEVLQSCVVLCRFFWEQKQLNDEAKDAVSALGCYVKRLLPPLQSLDPRSVANAIDVLSYLQDCLKNSQGIFAKYKTGWKSSRFWVTPAQIKAKAKAQEERTRHAWYDLSVVLNIQGHNALHPSAPSAVETKPDDTFELPAGAVVVDRKRNNLPTTVLGQGSFGIVGLGSLKSGDGSTAPVAVKMAMPNVLAAADSQPQIVEAFRREVRFLATIEHPNIVQCYGCVTREEGELSMWIVMEKLDITLSSAINDKHLQVGRNNPQTYVELVAGICSAMAYLHTPINGNPVVHRDVKPENIMLNNISDCVVKLVDFGLAKETVRSGVGSTMNVKGTREWMAPEQLTDGGCSVSSDMYAAGLVAAFIWSGLTPDQSPVAQIKVEETADPRAKFTQQLMLQCLNRVPNNRPAAAFVSFQLENFAPPPAPAPAGAPTQASAEASVAGVGFLALIGIDDPVVLST